MHEVLSTDSLHHIDTLRESLVSPFDRWANWASEKLNNLTKVTQPKITDPEFAFNSELLQKNPCPFIAMLCCLLKAFLIIAFIRIRPMASCVWSTRESEMGCSCLRARGHEECCSQRRQCYGVAGAKRLHGEWTRRGWRRGRLAPAPPAIRAGVWSSVRSRKWHPDLIITSLCGLWRFLLFLPLLHGVQIYFHINRNDSSFLSTSLLVALWNVPGRGNGAN